MSLVVLLSLLGFSVSANTPIEQKRTETENTVSVKQSSKQRASFNQLQAELTSANFFIALSKTSTSYLKSHQQHLMLTSFYALLAECDIFLKPGKLYQLSYPARSADDLLFS